MSCADMLRLHARVVSGGFFNSELRALSKVTKLKKLKILNLLL